MTNPDPTSSAAKARKITPQDPPQYPCLLSNNGVVYDGPFFAMPTTSLGRDKYTGWWIPRDLSPIPDAPYVKIEAGVEVKTPTWCYDYMWQWVPVPGHVLSQYTHTCANPADRKPSGRPERTMAEAAADPVECEKLANEFAGIAPTSLPRRGDWAESELAAIIRSACPQIGDEFLKERASSIDNAFKRGLVRGIEWEKKQAALRAAPQPHAGQADLRAIEEVLICHANFKRGDAMTAAVAEKIAASTTPPVSGSGKLRALAEEFEAKRIETANRAGPNLSPHTDGYCDGLHYAARKLRAALATPAETGREPVLPSMDEFRAWAKSAGYPVETWNAGDCGNFYAFFLQGFRATTQPKAKAPAGVEVQCATCEGNGYGLSGEKCEQCGGTGKVIIPNLLRTASGEVAEAGVSEAQDAGELVQRIVNDMGELRDALREALTLPKLYDNLRTIADDERRCARRRSHLDVTGDGAFGIAVASDEWALEWQKLHAESKTIKERIDAIITRCASLANASSDRPNDAQCGAMSQQPGKQL